MGKATYHRVITVPTRSKVAASCPVTGGVLFFVGSFCFFPGERRDDVRVGAVCFLLGSVLYLIQPLVDYWDLTYGLNLAEPAPSKVTHWWDWWTERAPEREEQPDYEYLYKSQMLRIQSSNAAIYSMGALAFVAG